MLCKHVVAGSIPAGSTIYRGVAQLVGRMVWDHEAVGSSPTTPAIRRKNTVIAVVFHYT